jgi:hypothetical protein
LSFRGSAAAVGGASADQRDKPLVAPQRYSVPLALETPDQAPRETKEATSFPWWAASPRLDHSTRSDARSDGVASLN